MSLNFSSYTRKGFSGNSEMISITIVSTQNSTPEKILCCDDMDVYNKCNVKKKYMCFECG